MDGKMLIVSFKEDEEEILDTVIKVLHKQRKEYILDKNGNKIRNKSGRGMDISELKIYVFDDMELWVQAAEEGADSEALNQAVLSAEIDAASLR